LIADWEMEKSVVSAPRTSYLHANLQAVEDFLSSTAVIYEDPPDGSPELLEKASLFAISGEK